MQLPIFDLFNTNSVQIDIILHGGSKGKDDNFMQKLVTKSKAEGHSVIAIDFPYITKGENPSVDLVDEVQALVSVIEMIKTLNYSNIRFVTKSLGGIVASKYLNNLNLADQRMYSIVVFGYAMPYINLDNFTGDITVVHGDNDRHGSIEDVKQNLSKSPSTNVEVITVLNADHSYNKEDAKENEAINLIYYK